MHREGDPENLLGIIKAPLLTSLKIEPVTSIQRYNSLYSRARGICYSMYYNSMMYSFHTRMFLSKILQESNNRIANQYGHITKILGVRFALKYLTTSRFIKM